jgi:hypothetical protein
MNKYAMVAHVLTWVSNLISSIFGNHHKWWATGPEKLRWKDENKTKDLDKL